MSLVAENLLDDGTQRQTEPHTDIATYSLNQTRGQFSEKDQGVYLPPKLDIFQQKSSGNPMDI